MSEKIFMVFWGECTIPHDDVRLYNACIFVNHLALLHNCFIVKHETSTPWSSETLSNDYIFQEYWSNLYFESSCGKFGFHQTPHRAWTLCSDKSSGKVCGRHVSIWIFVSDVKDGWYKWKTFPWIVFLKDNVKRNSWRHTQKDKVGTFSVLTTPLGDF